MARRKRTSEEVHGSSDELPSPRVRRRTPAIAEEISFVDGTSSDEESDNDASRNRELRIERMAAEIARVALFNAGKPLRRLELRKQANVNALEFNEMLERAKAQLRSDFGLALVPLADYAQSSHGAMAKQELVLVDIINDRGIKRTLTRLAPRWARFMYMVLLFSLCMLVMETDGLEESQMLRLLHQTGIFAEEFNDTKALITPPLERLVLMRQLDLTRDRTRQDESGKPISSYIIGPAAVATVSRAGLFRAFRQISFPKIKEEDMSSQQRDLLLQFSQFLDRSIFKSELNT